MKKIITFIANLMVSVMFLSFLAACQEEDLGFTVEEVTKGAFRHNFEKEYGPIDENQSWDLYRKFPRTAKFQLNEPLTRAVSGYTDATDAETAALLSRPGSDSGNDFAGWYDVQKATLDWLNNSLKEEKNNTGLGEPFALVPPSNQFAIIPIYQGKAGMNWDLHLVDKETGKDYKIWTESQGLRYSDDGTNWTKPGTTYDDSYTIGKKYIKGQPIIVKKDAIKGEFFLYLDVTEGQGGYATTGTKQRSDEGMMLALHCPLPTNLDAFTAETGSLVMVVGCEDADQIKSDWDMNDVVFIIAGYPLIPDIVEYTHKRYMCEDLGNTYDFDFNDIVIDVDQTSYLSAKMNADKSQIIREENLAKRQQTATVKHVCGTIPFEVTVGDYTFNVVTDPTNRTTTVSELTASTGTRADVSESQSSESSSSSMGWNPEVTKTITGWDATANNVSIRVSTMTTADDNSLDVITAAFADKAQDSNGNLYTIDFPGPGKSPLIIAVDQTVEWMAESVHIPESWWKTGDVFIKHETEKDPKPEPEPAWDYSSPKYELDTDGNAILWDGSQGQNGGYSQCKLLYTSDEGERGDAMKKLFQAFDAGMTYITLYFDKNVSADYAVHGNSWKELRKDKISDSDHLLLALTAEEIENIRSGNAGLAIEFWNANANITSIIASETSPIKLYTVSVATQDGSMGSVSGGGEGETGVSMTIKATPNTGYKFVKWMKDDVEIPVAGAEYSFSLSNTTAGNYSAVFEEATKYTLTISAGENGSVSPSGANQYYEASDVTLTATPAEGYIIKQWTKNGEIIEGAILPSLTVTVDGNDTYAVEFKAKPVTITLFEGTQATDGCQQIPDIDTSKLYVGATLKIYFTGGWLNVHYGQWNQAKDWSGNPATKVLDANDVSTITSKGLWAHGDGNVTKVVME